MKDSEKVYPETKYITFFRRRFIFREGKYHGWYFYR